jgi:hypothetical protein
MFLEYEPRGLEIIWNTRWRVSAHPNYIGIHAGVRAHTHRHTQHTVSCSENTFPFFCKKVDKLEFCCPLTFKAHSSTEIQSVPLSKHAPSRLYKPVS